jgi:hypothetical protein
MDRKKELQKTHNGVTFGQALASYKKCLRNTRDLIDNEPIDDLRPFTVLYRGEYDNPLRFLKADPVVQSDNMYEKGYRQLITVLANSLDHVYEIMQGENFSPKGEARDMIIYKGLQHTSMSVGDIIVDRDADRAYQVDGNGFKEVE